MYRVFPHFEKQKKRLGNFTPLSFTLHTGFWKCVECEFCTFWSHVCSTNGKSLKRSFQPYQTLKVAQNPYTAFYK